MSQHHSATPGASMATPAAQRLAAVAELAATLPIRCAAELRIDPDGCMWPTYAATEILPGLHQGGTEDYDVLSVPGSDHRRRGGYPFNTVVTLYASAQPVPWGVEELRFGFYDTALDGSQITTVLRAAQFAYERWLSGAEVLIRCQAGMNRSGLVTALVLTMAGLEPSQAITLIRRQRSDACLFNGDFTDWLVEHSEAALAELDSGRTGQKRSSFGQAA